MTEPQSATKNAPHFKGLEAGLVVDLTVDKECGHIPVLNSVGHRICDSGMSGKALVMENEWRAAQPWSVTFALRRTEGDIVQLNAGLCYIQTDAGGSVRLTRASRCALSPKYYGQIYHALEAAGI